ncbi:cytochrome C oxidase subunit I [Massilia antarctica]|uniref:Cytochrome C oxidase subunit I n=2 Tax=Massilia antarctica TaxID=2765360 RepID=A0AA48WGS4_9BURK|nr:cytochrome C oxidase subunit I [Massilia antarctica]
MEQKKTTEANQWSGRWKLLAVVFVCAAPMLFSYLTYYVIKPTGRTNYGALIDPQLYPIPAALGATTLDGKPAALDNYKGKWIMLQVGPGECPQACRDQLVAMRQLRLMQGKEMERLERVWLVTDATPIDTMLIRVVDGTHMLRVPAAAVTSWLPVEPGGNAADHMYLIDPMGHLMMRFPKQPDPSKVKKDIGKVLKASAIG